MKNIEQDLTDLYSLVESCLRARARSITFAHEPIRLRTAYKSFLILTDRIDREFRADETYLSSFREIYTNKQYRLIRLDEWQLEVKFQGKRTSQIDLICTAATFHVNRVESRSISGCYLKLHLFEGVNMIEHLTPECLGYLRRLAKKQICEGSGNVAREYSSLLSFAPNADKSVRQFDYRPWEKEQAPKEIDDPLSTLTPAGLQALEKLRHFVKRQYIYNFIKNSQVSKEAVHQLEKIASNRLRQRTQFKKQEQS